MFISIQKKHPFVIQLTIIKRPIALLRKAHKLVHIYICAKLNGNFNGFI